METTDPEFFNQPIYKLFGQPVKMQVNFKRGRNVVFILVNPEFEKVTETEVVITGHDLVWVYSDKVKRGFINQERLSTELPLKYKDRISKLLEDTSQRLVEFAL